MSESKSKRVTVRVETYFPGDEKPAVKTEIRPVRIAGNRVEIWSVGQWVRGKMDGETPVLTVDLRRSKSVNVKLSE